MDNTNKENKYKQWEGNYTGPIEYKEQWLDTQGFSTTYTFDKKEQIWLYFENYANGAWNSQKTKVDLSWTWHWVAPPHIIISYDIVIIGVPTIAFGYFLYVAGKPEEEPPPE